MAEDFISGALAGQQFRQQAETIREQPQLFELSMAEGRTKLAGAQMDLQERQSALDNAKAIQQIQAKALKAAQLGQGDPNADPTEKTTDMLQAMGTADIEGGYPVQGAELLKQSVVIAKDHAEIVSKQSETQQKKLSFVTSGLDDVMASPDPQKAWRDFNMLAASEFKGALDPKIANRPYDRQFIQMLRDTAQTQLQKSEADRNKAQERLADVEARKNEAEIPLERARTRAENALADQREKNAGIAGGPSKADLDAAYDAVKGEFGKGADKEAAKAASRPVAERAAQLIKQQGLPRSVAIDKAIQEEKAKPGSRLSGLSKPPAVAEAGVEMIDNLLGMLDKAEASNMRITGYPGMIRRVAKEDIGGTVGLTDETLANDFASQLTALHTELPALLLKSKSAGYFSKLKAEKMASVARGLSPGDNINTTRSSLLQLRETLSGEKPADKPSSANKEVKYTAGDRYTDAKGRSAIYLGGDPKKPESWQPTN